MGKCQFSDNSRPVGRLELGLESGPRVVGRIGSKMGKKLARLLFDFDVVDTTDDDCKQQVPSGALCLQQLTTLVLRRHGLLG